MFVTIKKKFLIIGLACVVAALAVIGGFASVRAVSSNNLPSNGMTVVIDAGHGGWDGGVTGVNTGIRESELNLAIARSLRHFFELHGYTVVMTRTTQEGLYGAAPQGSRKRTDMERRRVIIEDASPDLVISIHLNAFPVSSVRGAQVFFAFGACEGTRAVATSVQSSLIANLEATTRQAAAGDYFILDSTRYPAILVEGGFLSNPLDEALLVTAAYQERLAYAIFCGVHALVAGGDWPW